MQAIERNREKSRKNLHKSPFHKFICEDLLDRLEPIDCKFNNILLINPILEDIFAKTLNKKYPDHKLTIIESTQQIELIKQKLSNSQEYTKYFMK